MARDYRNPQFSYRHALRDAGADGIVSSQFADDERLFDGQARVLSLSGGTGVAAFDFDRGFSAPSTNANQGELDRVILPRGHNLHANRLVDCKFIEDGATFGSATDRDQDDGITHTLMHPSSDHAVWDFDSSASATSGYDAGIRLSCKASGASPASKAEVGELWWTKREQPTTGIVSAWAEQYVPNDLRVETDSGAAYVVERGAPRRFFSLEHRHVTGADLMLYEDLFRYTRLGRRAFWYEHPSGGGSGNLLGDTTSTANWIVDSPGTLAVDGEYLEVTANAAATIGVKLNLANWVAGAPTDWRDSILSFDFRVDEHTGSWAEQGTGSVYLRVTAGGTTKFNRYNLADPIQTSAAGLSTATNYRMQVDLENDADVVGSVLPADLRNPTQFSVHGVFLNAANQFKIRQPRIFSKTSRPHLVEIVGQPRIVQDRSAPKAAGPSFTIAFDMLEVIT